MSLADSEENETEDAIEARVYYCDRSWFYTTKFDEYFGPFDCRSDATMHAIENGFLIATEH